jgi:hypothetical protein
VPTTPISVHTAYAVPKGRDWLAIPSKLRLMIKAKMVATLGQRRLNPSLNFKPVTQAISNRAAMTRMIHGMTKKRLPGSSTALNEAKMQWFWESSRNPAVCGLLVEIRESVKRKIRQAND